MKNLKSLMLTIALLAAAAMLLAVPNSASAQVKPVMVRSVDEPAPVPYSYTLNPICYFGNVCAATFPVVPAGKRLRVTRISVFWRDQTAAAFLVLDTNTISNPVVIFPLSPAVFAYYGSTYSMTQEIDHYFEAGQAPVLEVGATSVFSAIYAAKLR